MSPCSSLQSVGNQKTGRGSRRQVGRMDWRDNYLLKLPAWVVVKFGSFFSLIKRRNPGARAFLCVSRPTKDLIGGLPASAKRGVNASGAGESLKRHHQRPELMTSRVAHSFSAIWYNVDPLL